MRRRGSSCPTIATGALVRASRFCTAAGRVSGARETLVTIPGGHAKANGRGGPAPARHPSSIRKRESATRGTRRFRVEGTVWRLRRPHFRTGGYCSLDFENPGARCRVPRYVGGFRSSDKSLTARLSRTLTGRAKQTHWWRKQASNLYGAFPVK